MKAKRKRTVWIYILPEEYPLFRADLPLDTGLPPDYAGWLHDNAIPLDAASGAQRVSVRYDEFVNWVGRMRISPTYAVLRAYAVTLSKTESSEEPAF